MSMEALRARRLITMQQEGLSVGQELFRPLDMQDNGLLLVRDGTVVYAGAFQARQIPAGVPVRDLGEVTLAPAAVNAHTHLQLSHLAGKTLWGQGFVAWLRSLIPLLSLPLDAHAVDAAVQSMRKTGTALAADYTSHGMALVGEKAQRHGLDCTLMAEWFGFVLPEEAGPWPPRCLSVLAEVPAALKACMSPVGHALYSTHERLLQAAHAWCSAHAVPFSLHLAEFPEETEALTQGTGGLVDLYRPAVLPPHWQAPGLPPVALAQHLNLLGPGTLAIHCVQCTGEDAALLAKTGTFVCLCPRSNQNLGVGTAPVQTFLEAGVPLCLGTDGLTSNTDLDVWQEALHLLQQGQLPARALLRMLTRNGAAALHRPDAGCLKAGARAAWTVLPQSMEDL